MKSVRNLCLLLTAAASLVPAAAASAPTGDEAPSLPLIVAFDDPAAVPAHGAAFLGGHVSVSRPEAGYAVVSTSHVAEAALEARHQPHVRYAEPDVEVHALGYTPNDPLWTRIENYAPRQIGATEVWNTTRGSTQVVICFVDSGIRVSHEDLRDHYVGGVDLVTGLSQPLDDLGHGTNVAGAAAAYTDNAMGMSGVASVGIRVAKVMSSTGQTSGSALTDGIRWCADTGSDVISISLGTTGYSQLLYDTVEYAWSKGSLLVASAGNSGPCTDCVEYPAKFDHVLAVGCFTSWNDKCVASSAGPELDVMAPGDKLLTTGYTSDSEYVVRSGTSIAAPVVAAVGALLRSINPTISNAQMADLIRSTAQDYGTAGPDPSFGWGLVRADRAAQQVGTPPASLPDLTVGPVSVSPSAPVQGQAVTASATVTNAGSAAAGAFRVQLLVDGVQAGSQSVSGLAAGASLAVSFPWTAVSGSHSLSIKADADATVAESSESNNAATAGVSVSAPPTIQRGVDLSPDGQSGKVKARGSVSYTLQVRNTGNAQDRILLSLGTVASGWTAGLSTTFVDLGPGQTQSITVTVGAGRLARGASMSLQVVATSAADASAQDVASITTTVG